MMLKEAPTKTDFYIPTYHFDLNGSYYLFVDLDEVGERDRAIDLAIELGYSPEIRFINWYDDRGQRLGLLLQRGSYEYGDEPMTEKMIDDIIALADELGREAVHYMASCRFHQVLAA